MRVLLATFAAAVLMAIPVVAQPRDAHERAVDLVTESAKHYEAGRFSEAIELLDRAYALAPSATILYNKGRAYEALGNLDSARQAYRDYIARDPKASDRRAVELRIASIERQIAEKERLAAERDAAAKRAAEERKRAEAQRQAADARERRARRAPRRDAGPGAWPWVLAGGGALIAGTGVGLGLFAQSAHDSAQEEELSAASEADNDRAKQLALGANICFALGGALVIGGVGWGLLASDGTEPKQGAFVGVRAGAIIAGSRF